MAIEQRQQRSRRAAGSSRSQARRRSRIAAPAIVRGQQRKAQKVSVGRQPWAAGNSPVTHYMITNKTFEKLRGRRRLRPVDRLSRLPVGGADGRGAGVGQSRLRHVGQHADRAPDRAEPAAADRQRRRGPFPLHPRDAQGFADPQHRRPEGQDRRRAARRRSVQRAVADAALRARQSRSEGARHHRRQHAHAGAGRDDSDRHGRRGADPSRVSQGQRRARHRRHHELVRLHRAALPRARGQRRRPPARVGEEVAVLSRRLLPAPLVLDRPHELHQEPSRAGHRVRARAAGSGREAVGDGSGPGVGDGDEVLGARRRSSARRWSRTRCCSRAAGAGRPRATRPRCSRRPSSWSRAR